MKKLYLDRLHGRFVKLIEKYQAENDCKQQDIADLIGVQRTHFNAIIHRAPNRPLTGYYLLKLITMGVFTVDEIYDGKSKTKNEDDFWRMAKVAGNHALLHRIAQLEEKGIDVMGILDAVDPDKK